jgi:6,7-dimethyl-8-ribityllumazine synthase
MATINKNLSAVGDLPAISPDWTFAIVKAEWNDEITSGLYDGAIELLLTSGVAPENIHTMEVPGSFELPLGAQWAIERYEVDAVICLGSVIRGETAHFDYVCQAVSLGIKDVSLEYNLPVIFGVLTDNNIEQSRARSGGKHGNKGTEAAATAVKMLALRDGA